MSSKEFSSFYSIFYIIYPLIIIYFFLILKGPTNLYDNLYDQLLLNDEKDYLRESFYKNDLIPSEYPSYFVDEKTKKINKDLISLECPMSIDDIKDSDINLTKNDENSVKNNSNDLAMKLIKINQLKNKKKQEKINEFIKNIRNSNCGCLPVPEKVFLSSYLCRSIGLQFLFKLTDKSKTNGIIEDIYKGIPNIKLEKNSNNLFLGQIPYDSSKSLIKILFNLLKGLTMFSIIKLWINTLTFYNLYSTISGSNIKVKKTTNIQGEKKTYYDGSKYFGIKSKLIFYALVLSCTAFLPLFFIQLPFFLYKKKLSNLKSILNPNSILIFLIYLIFTIIFINLSSNITSGTSSLILNTAKDGFNSNDYPLLNDLSYSFSLFHNNKNGNFIYYSLQLIILITLFYCIYTAFKPNITFLITITIIIFISSFISVFQFGNEGNFDDIFKNCGINNANPYSYTNKFRNLPFWNITSAFIKYNYKNF
jgi:hypothetical protein